LRKVHTSDTFSTPESVREKTRPYLFGDFDILAVNLHPSTGDWKNFRYTVASWLIPRSKDKTLIEVFQPVAAIPNSVWANDLSVCLKWLESSEQRQVIQDVFHRRGSEKMRT
jgi:hypothetical protein